MGTLFLIFFFHPFLQDFFQDSDDDWIFDPAIDAILEAHGQKRTRDEAFSDDDNVSDQSYWDWLPPELKDYIVSLAWHQHLRDLKQNTQINPLLRGQRLYQVEEDLGSAHKLLIMPGL